MARTNRRKTVTTSILPDRTYEGGPAKDVNPRQALRRAVLSGLLWEQQFYESGEHIADRVRSLVKAIAISDEGSAFVSDLAIEARQLHGLRHMPLYLANALSDSRKLRGSLLPQIIQRADELTEFLAMYWSAKSGGRRPISNQVKKGLAEAFISFDPYELAKYNRDNEIKLRDVMFLTHPKPDVSHPAFDKQARKLARGAEHISAADTYSMEAYGLSEQEKTWYKLANNSLESPDTWEVNLSAGQDKKETFERLLRERKLGGLAIVRNLRLMTEQQVDRDLIVAGLNWIDRRSRIMPYQFVAAARHAPSLELEIEQAMFRSIDGLEKLKGKTVLLIDVSGSMDAVLSTRSEMRRVDAAAGLAILAREMCEKVEVYRFRDSTSHVAPRRGFALRDAIGQAHGGTYLGEAVKHVTTKVPDADRLIVFTDEQSHDRVSTPPFKRSYMVNVAAYQHSVGYGNWLRIDGFSEQIIHYIRELERLGENDR